MVTTVHRKRYEKQVIAKMQQSSEARDDLEIGLFNEGFISNHKACQSPSYALRGKTPKYNNLHHRKRT